MTEVQIQLQNALTTTFLANLAFLSEYDNNLYHRVDELSRMIENETYKEKYALEFIMESGDFDIYDIVNDKHLYNKNSKKMTDKLIKKVQFDGKDSILTLETIYAVNDKIEQIDKNIKFNIENLSESTNLTIQNIYEYSSILKNSLDRKKKRLKKIKKFIFLGTLLGRHIPKISEKVDADIYLVLERNLEIFRLSLFTVDYTVLARKSMVIFSVMDSILEEEDKIAKFLNVHLLENYLIKFSTTGINISEYIDKILSSYMLIKPTSYDYNRYLYTYTNRATNALNSKYKVLLMNQIKEKFALLEETPILFLAAGPSLSENIEWIKANQNKFFIITIGSAYKKLLSSEIKIDMIFTLDEQYDVLNKTQFDDESVSKIAKNTIVMASVITDNRILSKFNQEKLFLYEVFIPFHKDNIEVSGFSVGEITLSLILNMNIKELYLIGLDLALNQKTGNTHFEDKNLGSSNYNLEDKDEDRSSFGLRDGRIKVKGNLQEEVYTTSLFFTSIKYVEKYLETKGNGVKVYNLSTHGAYYENSIPKKIDEIQINNFTDIKLDRIEILNALNSFSVSSLGKESKLSVNSEIIFIKNFLLIDFENYKNYDATKYDDFFTSTIDLISLITDYEFAKSSISQILRNYALLIIPYLTYCFNDKKIKDEEKKLKKIKIVFIEQIESIIKDYILFLERISK